MPPIPGIVIPSSLRVYTDAVRLILERNPSLGQQVVNCLNSVDRSRNKLFRQTLGDLPCRMT